MAEATTRHGLPLLQAGQAQKEVTHNEALVLLDLLAHPVVEGVLAAPPASPTPGQGWIIGAGATSAWAGREGAVACWTPGGWRFLAAQAGMMVWQKADGSPAWFDGDTWRTDGWPTNGLLVDGQKVVGTRGSAIATPAGGTTVDGEARAAIGQILAALRTHGLIAT